MPNGATDPASSIPGPSIPGPSIPASSIVVPSYGRPDALRACLDALVAQDDPSFEVVVVDDGSPEPAARVCEGMARVRCVRQDNAGPAAARNRGAREARGTFLAFTDDDCRPRPDWLSRLHAAWGGDPDLMVGGRVENGLPDNPYAEASQSLCDFLYHWGGAEVGEAPFFTTNNAGLAREGFERLGGFDESFPLAAAEDRDLGLRWREMGGRLTYAPRAVVDHHHALTLRRFFRQHANYGRGAHHLHGVLRARGALEPGARPPVERPAFYWGMLTWPLRRRGVRGVPLSLLIGLSQAAMVRGYGEEARAQRRRPRAHEA